MLTESARMSSAAEARFRIEAQPTQRNIKVINLDTGTSTDVARLIDGMGNADLVVMVVSAGASARAVATIGQACSDRRIMTHTIVVHAGSASDEALSRTLVQVRPWSLMVVVANSDDYVEDILRSFR
jgi:hypothetical protein